MIFQYILNYYASIKLQVSDVGIESLCCQVQIRDKVPNDSTDQESCLSGNADGIGSSGKQYEYRE